jgi:DNA-binding protein YbaB
MNIAWIKYDDKGEKYGKAVYIEDELIAKSNQEQLIDLILSACNLLACDYEFSFNKEVTKLKPLHFKIIEDKECG